MKKFHYQILERPITDCSSELSNKDTFIHVKPCPLFLVVAFPSAIICLKNIQLKTGKKIPEISQHNFCST